MSAASTKVLILIPAFNEEAALSVFLPELGTRYPILVVDDGSVDHTAAVARKHGAVVLRLPQNLGVGGAVQAGCGYAWRHGYDQVVRLDGDGQHPAECVSLLLDAIERDQLDMVTGSRFLSEEVQGYQSTRARQMGIGFLASALSRICRQRITDPTSGCFAINRRLIYYFSHRYPADYPEPEALALIARQGYHFGETAVQFRERQAGASSITGWGPAFYMLKVGLALLVDRARSVDPHFQRRTLDWVDGAQTP